MDKVKLENVGCLKQAWVQPASSTAIKVWIADDNGYCSVINRVEYEGFLSIRKGDEGWYLSPDYTTARRKGGRLWYGSVSDSARQKLEKAAEIIINDWIPENCEAMKEAELKEAERELEFLRDQEAEAIAKLEEIRNAIAGQEMKIKELSPEAEIEIVLDRAEGTIQEAEEPPTVVKSWSEAHEILKKWAMTCPEQGYANKTDILVKWSDGVSYKEQFDLTLDYGYKHREGIRAYIRDSIGFYTGEHRPDHLTVEQYNQFINTYVPNSDRRNRFKKMYNRLLK